MKRGNKTPRYTGHDHLLEEHSKHVITPLDELKSKDGAYDLFNRTLICS